MVKRPPILPSKEDFEKREAELKEQRRRIDELEDKPIPKNKKFLPEKFDRPVDDKVKRIRTTKLTEKFKEDEAEQEKQLKLMIKNLEKDLSTIKDLETIKEILQKSKVKDKNRLIKTLGDVKKISKKDKQKIQIQLEKSDKKLKKEDLRFGKLATNITGAQKEPVLVHTLDNVFEVVSSTLPPVKEKKEFQVVARVKMAFKRKTRTCFGRSGITSNRSKQNIEDRQVEAFNNAVRQCYRKLGARYDSGGIALLEFNFSYVYYLNIDLRKDRVSQFKRIEQRGF